MGLQDIIYQKRNVPSVDELLGELPEMDLD